VSDDPKEPRYRPYRGLAWAGYLVFAVGFSSLIVFSVFKSVLAMTPEPPAYAGAPLDEIQCFNEAKNLFNELESHRKGLADSKEIVKSDQAFLEFRLEWLTRKRSVEARCGLDSRPRTKAAYDSLDRVMDLYTTASVQFAGAVGPATDEFKNLVDAK
jgi:hypothetical protein